MKYLVIVLIIFSSIIFAQENDSLYNNTFNVKDALVNVSEYQQYNDGMISLFYKIEIKYNNSIIKKEGKLKRSGIIDCGIRDFDNDDDFEIYMTCQSEGSGAYGYLIFFEFSQSELISHELPELNSNIRPYYKGHDKITVNDNSILREFPAYNEEDANCCPTAGRISVEYIFKDSELIENGYSFKREVSKEKIVKTNLTIISAKHLPGMDVMSKCDSWIEVVLNAKVVGTTEIQKDNNSPIYDATFTLEGKDENLLQLKVYDKDITKNELVGIVTLENFQSGTYPILREVANGSIEKFGELILEFNSK